MNDKNLLQRVNDILIPFVIKNREIMHEFVKTSGKISAQLTVLDLNSLELTIIDKLNELRIDLEKEQNNG